MPGYLADIINLPAAALPSVIGGPCCDFIPTARDWR
jgi:hypothetical protein